MKVAEISTLNTDELKKKLDESYRELFNLRFRLATKQLGNYHAIRNVRKKVAKIKTIMRERELQ